MAALPPIVFDVNETLLDLTTMEPTFERIFRDKGAMRLWFARIRTAGSSEREPDGFRLVVDLTKGDQASATAAVETCWPG